MGGRLSRQRGRDAHPQRDCGVSEVGARVASGRRSAFGPAIIGRTRISHSPPGLVADRVRTAIRCGHENPPHLRAAPALSRRHPRRSFDPCPHRPGQRAELARPADQAPGSVRRRRQHRRDRPPDGGAALGGARPADGGREPGRRRRHHRHGGGAARGAGRLHAVVGQHQRHGHRAGHDQGEIRPGEGLRPDQRTWLEPAGAAGQFQGAGQDRCRIRRLREGAAGSLSPMAAAADPAAPAT